MGKPVTNLDRCNDNIRQTIGFRIWNTDRSAILLYLSEKSATWTLPSIRTTVNHGVVNSFLLLLNQFTKAELVSAFCILNIKEFIPIRLPDNVVATAVSFQYIIYDVTIQLKNLIDIELPDNIKFPQFVSTGYMTFLAHKTPILGHLMEHMKKDEQILIHK